MKIRLKYLIDFILRLTGNNNTEIIEKILNKEIMPKPNEISDEMYSLMKRCWRYRPNERCEMLILANQSTEFLDNVQWFEFENYCYHLTATFYHQPISFKFFM